MVQHAMSVQYWMKGDKTAQESMSAIKDGRRKQMFAWVGFTGARR